MFNHDSHKMTLNFQSYTFAPKLTDTFCFGFDVRSEFGDRFKIGSGPWKGFEIGFGLQSLDFSFPIPRNRFLKYLVKQFYKKSKPLIIYFRNIYHSISAYRLLWSLKLIG